MIIRNKMKPLKDLLHILLEVHLVEHKPEK